jgi:hypothetical protein
MTTTVTNPEEYDLVVLGWQSERTLDFDSPFFTNGLDEFCRLLRNGAISSGTFKQHFERLQIVVHGLCGDLADQSISKRTRKDEFDVIQQKLVRGCARIAARLAANAVAPAIRSRAARGG